jgi:hypothetical protein
MEISHDNSCFFFYKKIFWKKRVLEKHVREGERLIKKTLLLQKVQWQFQYI